MVNIVYRRDQIDLDLVRRRQALAHAIASLRSAGTAALAARCGNPRTMRDALLSDLNRRIESMVRELRALE